MIGQESQAKTSQAVRRACQELGSRLRSGQDCSVEDFLAAEPALNSDSEWVLELAYTEFVVREELGQQPTPKDWLQRFPQLREELSQVFDVHQLVAADSNHESVGKGTRLGSALDLPPSGFSPSDRRFVGIPSAPRVGSYELIEEIGRGGMGVVYKARQLGLGRMVALKTILAPDEPRERARFRMEAEATARLSHPNIVPIYEVGESDGCPFLSMELIEGCSLWQQLAQSPLAAQAAAELLLTLARAVEHAHSQGVLHRDLKPANILLASDGTPRITDFGLARKFPTPDSASGECPASTQNAAIVGTPGYIAPEQCQGTGKHVGPAADIYALGAILYETLTGRPPFRGETAFATLEMSRWQEPVPPSRLAPKIPRDLETICLKCLAKQPQQRYGSAALLADDLQRFLALEPIAARRSSVAERTWRLCQRQPLGAALTAALALAVVAGVGGVFWQWQRAENHARAARSSATLERAARELAEQRFTQAQSAVELYLDGLERDERLKQPDFFVLRKQLLESALPFYEDFVRQSSGDAHLEAKRGMAYERLATLRRSLGEHQQAVADLEAMKSIYKGLDPRDAHHRLQLAKACRLLGIVQHELGQHVVAEEEQENALAIYRLLAAEYPNAQVYRTELAICLNNLGVHRNALGSKAAAREAFAEALASLKSQANEIPQSVQDRTELARAHHNLGTVLPSGEALLAQTHLEQAVVLRKQLAEERPAAPQHRQDLAISHFTLGTLLYKIGKHAESEAELNQTIPLQTQLASDFPAVPQYRWELARTHFHLGTTLLAMTRRFEAETQHRQALASFQQLVADFPDVPDYASQLAQCQSHLGIVLDQLGRAEEAEAAYRGALDLQRQLLNDFPLVSTYREHLAASHYNLAYFLSRRGQKSEAESEYRLSAALRQELTKDPHSDVVVWQKLASSQRGLAAVLVAQGKFAEAEQAYREELVSQTELLQGSPDDLDCQAGVAKTLNGLASALQKQGKLAEAERAYAEAAQHHWRVHQSEPSNRKFADALWMNYYRIAETALLRRDHRAIASAAARLSDVRLDMAEDAVWAARFFGRCAEIVAEDLTLCEEERCVLTCSYCERAMENLQTAVRRGFRERNFLATAPALAPLRSRTDFQELLRSLDE